MPKIGYGYAIYTGKPGLPPVVPDEISGLSLWLRADAGVTINASNVTAWADQSGNNLNFSSLTGVGQATQYPSTISNGIAGKPSISFLNSLMRSPNLNIGSNGLSVFVVGYSRGDAETGGSGGDLQPYINLSDMASALWDAWVVGAYAGSETDFQTAWVSSDDGADYFSITYENAVNTARIITYVCGSGTISAFVNGSLANSASATNPQSLNKPMGIGNRSIINEGAEPGNRENFDGVISEIIVYDRELNSTERQQIELYLNRKYYLY